MAGLVAVGTAAAVSPASAQHDHRFQRATGCVALPAAPVFFGANTGAYAVGVGIPCTYTATAAGGYRVPTGAWTMWIERGDRTYVLGSRGGNARCRTSVVQPGDRIELVAEVYAEVGSASSC